KPSGAVTHPTKARRTGTLVNRLLGMGMPLSSGLEADRPGIVHRLDAGTSGLLVVAKDDETQEALGRLFRDHRVDRRYLALAGWATTPAGSACTGRSCIPGGCGSSTRSRAVPWRSKTRCRRISSERCDGPAKLADITRSPSAPCGKSVSEPDGPADSGCAREP